MRDKPRSNEKVIPAKLCTRTHSKRKFQSELDDAWVSCIWIRAGNRAKAASSYTRVRIVEVDLVEDVEHLGAELNADLLFDREVLEEPQIPSKEMGPIESPPADSPECSYVINGERCRIEPDSLVCPCQWRSADSGEFRAVTVDSGLRIIPATRNSERTTSLVLSDTRNLPSVEHTLHECVVG